MHRRHLYVNLNLIKGNTSQSVKNALVFLYSPEVIR